MQASELYEIVKDVPREAWPEQFDWYECGGDTPYRCFTVNGEEYNYKNNLLEVAFVGSMTAWLIHRGRLTLRGNVFAGVVAYAIVEIEPIEPTGANTLVAALAAACKEVGGNGN
jgi:hypothetical protein